MSRAIVMRRTGPPEVLVLEDRPLAPLAPGEVRLRARASAVNYSDLQLRSGAWPIRRDLPYVPGLEVVGEVVEVASDVAGFAVGDVAWTAMQGLGGVRAERDGGYAERVTVSASALAHLPRDLDEVRFAAVGLAGVTALEGLRRCGPLKGKTLLVTGVTGGVGAVAVEVGRALGASIVVGLARHDPAPEPGTVDAVLDTVAGPLFPALVEALRPGGRYCLVGAAGGGDVSFDAWSLLDGRALTGWSSESLDGDVLRAATRLLVAMNVHVPTTTFPLAEAARAHALLEARAIGGRVVLTPGR